MITKTHKGDLGLGLPEIKKKKKKVVKEPETEYSVLNSDSYFSEVCPTRATSPLKNVVQGKAPEMSLVKKKKKKKKGHSAICEEQLESGVTLHARPKERSPSPRKQALGSSEFLSGEKKKKSRKSLLPLVMSPGSKVKTSPDRRRGEEVTGVCKKLKKHKKEKTTQEAAAFSARNPWLGAGDALYSWSVGKGGVEQAASGQKGKQRSPREHSVKIKKKKKTHQEGDSPVGHPEFSRSTENSLRKGSKKKLIKVEAPEYIPIGHGSKFPAKKKMKSKKNAQQPGIEEPALKRKKRKESRVADPWKEEPDTDLEVVLEKKGNMDEAHIDQVRRKALQEEIDRESGKTEASESRKCTQSLQQDYDRAMSWKYRRGTGLGFSSAPDKTFYVDRNASKSIKFED
ncbi:hypothetical protein MC885_001892 [Smutsia gigantea]|nr:hypothetical protein MC885_001892 [Smutsia gigantea]